MIDGSVRWCLVSTKCARAIFELNSLPRLGNFSFVRRSNNAEGVGGHEPAWWRRETESWPLGKRESLWMLSEVPCLATLLSKITQTRRLLLEHSSASRLSLPEMLRNSCPGRTMQALTAPKRSAERDGSWSMLTRILCCARYQAEIQLQARLGIPLSIKRKQAALTKNHRRTKSFQLRRRIQL